MSQLKLPQETLLRVIMSAVAAELRDGCGRVVEPMTIASWSAQTGFGEDGLDLDSLELLSCAGRINQLFHMHESGIEDYLLRDRSFGDWARIVEISLQQAGERLTFLTSGSTGEPKPCTHGTASLEQEIAAFAPLLTGVKRIIACVPSHHIYGFLFTALMPRHLDIPVIEGRFLSPGQWSGALQQGDLIVSSPSYWQYLTRSLPHYRDGVMGLTSTAPMPRTLSDTLATQGLSRLIEIYGSSETAGVGWRDDPADPYTLLPFWHSLPDGQLVRSLPEGGEAASLTPMDLLIWEPPTAMERRGPVRFRPAGRRDNAVQVGGINVFPARIAAVICDHDLVAKCTVRPAQDAAIDRLKAHIMLKGNIDPTPAIVRDIEAWCRDHLKPNERPRLLSFGDDITDTDTLENSAPVEPLRKASGF